MKARKIFGILFTILGSMTAFLSLAVLILPMIANDQTNLVLQSFYRPSDNFLVSSINKLMTFLLDNSVLMLAGGTGLLLVGILLLLSASRYEEEQKASKRSAERSQVMQQRQDPVWKRPSPTPTGQANPFATAISNPAPQRETFPDKTETDDAPEASPTIARPSVYAPPQAISEEEEIDKILKPSDEPYPMSPDDIFFSPGTPRRLTHTETPSNPAAPVQEPKNFIPLFSTTPADSPSKPEEKPEVPAVPADVPQTKPKVTIRSTMGKHSV